MLLATTKPKLIATWAAQCLKDGLYLAEGVGRVVFATPEKIQAMAYMPGVGWAMFHQNPVSPNGTMIYGVYVTPSERGKGWSRQLSRTLGKEIERLHASTTSSSITT